MDGDLRALRLIPLRKCKRGRRIPAIQADDLPTSTRSPSPSRTPTQRLISPAQVGTRLPISASGIDKQPRPGSTSVDSQDLFGNAETLHIQHRGVTYTLRQTRNGKLILPQRLNALLSSADVVICAIDCVSPDAYNRSKRFHKRFAKPCVLLRSSGVSTFARALEQVASQGRDRHPPSASGLLDSVSPAVILENPGQLLA